MAELTPIQSLMRPEEGLCTEAGLYVRRRGAARFAGPDLRLGPGGGVRFDTYANLFALGRWRRCCGLASLRLRIGGSGRVTLALEVARPGGRPARVRREEVDLPVELDLADLLADEPDDRRLLILDLAAETAATITAVDWLTADAPRRDPRLTLAITTFRREAAVARSVARFTGFLAAHPAYAGRLHLVVVDNGGTAEIPASETVTPVTNRNFGGAGGFARGLIEARGRGASHCLFMDDDAAVHMDSIARTWTFLAYVRDPATAVSGAMITADRPTRLWENGATFHGGCHPIAHDTDLTDWDELAEMEHAAAGPAPAHFYGGWWFFAFPIAPVRHLPFPFFVRGDDVSFSLVHDFTHVTLNGVASFQDGFTGKESPLTWYLDLRSHLAHHLSLPGLDIPRWKLLRLPAWFYARNLLRMHYETLAAINLAVEDVLAGPDHFAATADLAGRRADLAALRRAEAFAPAAGPRRPDEIRLPPGHRSLRLLLKLTFNGHLVPFFSRFGNRITLDATQRGRIRKVWGASELTVRDGARAYTVRHSKRAAFREGWRLTRLLVRLAWRRDALRRDWQAGYPRLTDDAFWTGALGLPKLPGPDAEPKGQDAAPSPDTA
ncbi:putative glycosyltransferase [Oceanicola granulosus HTCC2516]|uniref:Putative glycosyltransferase n=1 Tax=Oceanicola granulosus (strain ATCC BAA-861 / DSM 15982 / KCTC 12143 / HTCC2516) TaxID=314256 RepID=Q2C9U8_OCEGH|nr:glycosyltransferase [Oceanicola granulosus]EAR49450.1 putative glycosyltransferase [Oceanicola granulosus HTCC2516]